MYCHLGGDCHFIMVECPEENGYNTYRVFYDDESTIDCIDMVMYTSNGYYTDAAVICDSG